MARKRKFSDEQIIAALTHTKGLVYHAARRIGCEADTIYNRSKVSPAVAKAMEQQRGEIVDLAESKLFTALKKGEPWAIQYALKHLGKSRGYGEGEDAGGGVAVKVYLGFDPAKV